MSAALLIGSYAGLVFGAVLGACLASFACVVGERMPRGESVGGRSHCACGRQLKSWENVPVLAWLVLRGRTRCCKVALPARYVIAEAALGAWGAMLGQLMWSRMLDGQLGAGVTAAAGAGLLAGFGAVCLLTRPRTTAVDAATPPAA